MLEAVKQGRISLTLEPVVLREVVDRTERLFADRLAERRITLVRPRAEALEVSVLADPSILANHILCNLVSNALKFSHDGSRIFVTATATGNEVSLSVRDHCVGIPEHMMPYLFDPLVRTSRPGLNDEPGTGFGLTTVKGFMDLFGGSVAVTSKEESVSASDHGTTVTVVMRRAFS